MHPAQASQSIHRRGPRFSLSPGRTPDVPTRQPVPDRTRCGRPCLPGGLRRAAARRQRPAEPGHLLPDLGGARGPRAHGPVHEQEHDRQGRVPPDGGDRAAMRADAGRSLERAAWQCDAVGCSAIGSSEACMLGGMAAKWRWRAKRRAEGKPTDRRTWCAGRCRWCGTSSPSTGTSRCGRSPCRRAATAWTWSRCWPVDENTIMVVPTFGVTYTGCLRAGARAL